MLQDILPGGLPRDVDATPNRPRGLLWRLPLWFALATALSAAWFAITFFRIEPGWWNLIVPILISLATAWALGLVRGRAGDRVRLGVIIGSLAVPFLGIFALLEGYMFTQVTDPPGFLRDATLEYPTTDATVTAALRRQAPPGSREQDLVALLQGQGFWIDRPHRRARYVWTSVVCGSTVDAQWTVTKDGRIATIKGDYGNACL